MNRWKKFASLAVLFAVLTAGFVPAGVRAEQPAPDAKKRHHRHHKKEHKKHDKTASPAGSTTAPGTQP